MRVYSPMTTSANSLVPISANLFLLLFAHAPHALRRPKLEKLHLLPDRVAESHTLGEWKDALEAVGVTPTPPVE